MGPFKGLRTSGDKVIAGVGDKQIEMLSGGEILRTDVVTISSVSNNTTVTPVSLDIPAGKWFIIGYGNWNNGNTANADATLAWYQMWLDDSGPFNAYVGDSTSRNNTDKTAPHWGLENVWNNVGPVMYEGPATTIDFKTKYRFASGGLNGTQNLSGQIVAIRIG